MPYFLRLGWPVAVKKQLGLSGDSIDGNSDDPGHRGWFDIDAFSFGNPRAPLPTDGTGGSRTANFDEIRFTRSADGLSVSLKRAVAQGTSFDVAFLDASAPGRSLAVKVENAILGSYQVGPSSGGLAVAEQFTLNFTGMVVLPTASIFASLAGINADPGKTAHALMMLRHALTMFIP
jgi:type VI protein secretion system component Hcp